MGESGKVCIFSGNANNKALNSRLSGFEDVMKEKYPEIEILEPRYTYDDDWVAEKIMEEILENHSDIKGVYITGHGEIGVCECLRKKKLNLKIKVVANDLVKENLPYLENESINFLIGQDPFTQGFEPSMILYRLLFEGISPEKELQYTDIMIKTKYNI